MENKILTCPFCGKIPALSTTESSDSSDERKGYNFEAIITCQCGVSLSVATKFDRNGWRCEGSDSVKKRCIDQWNTRSTLPLKR